MQIVNAEKFYGRLKSRALTETQKILFDELLPQLKIQDTEKINVEGYNRIFFEIGFGSGEHIANLAMQNPHNLFIGCEPFVNGVASLLCKINENNIKNIRIFNDDARKIIRSIEDFSIDGVFLMFPDPWPKRRHIERRFINKTNIEKIHRVLKTGGFWKIATDHIDYAKYTLKTFENFGNLFSKKEKYSKQTRPSELDWPHTRYEQKSVSESFLYIVYEAREI